MEKKAKAVAEVRVLGQKIGLKCPDSDPEIVDQIIELVSIRLRNAELRTKGIAAHHVAVLALVDLAEEYIKAKHRTIEFKREMDQKAAQLLNLIETEKGSGGAGPK